MKTLLLLAFLVLPTAAYPQVPVFTGINTNGDLVRYLERIADTATVEHARCLVGFVHDSTLIIDAAAETPWLVRGQSDSGVFIDWEDCPAQTVGIWHNHVLAWVRARYGPSIPECYLGGGDKTVLLKRASPPVQLVSVRMGLTCTFVRLPSGELVAAETVR